MSLYENITICNTNNRFPIEGADLVMGQIYMGSDMLLYVGVGGLPQPFGGDLVCRWDRPRLLRGQHARRRKYYLPSVQCEYRGELRNPKSPLRVN